MGPVERSVRADLRTFPDEMRKGALAVSALLLARELDEPPGDLSARDRAGYVRELRMLITQLRELAPGEVKGDPTDDAREKRERRLRLVTQTGE